MSVWQEHADQLISVYQSSNARQNLSAIREIHQRMHEHQLETTSTVTATLNEIVQVEEQVGQKLLDKQTQIIQSDKELRELEEEQKRCTVQNQNMESELQFLRGELESLRSAEQELQALQQEVDEDTTEVIPSSIYVSQLYQTVTRIKWQHDTEPHVLRGVHYGPELATPININTSTRTPFDISNDLWSFVSTEW